MKLSKKEIIGSISIGIAIIGIWLIFRKKKDENLSQYEPQGTGGSGEGTGGSSGGGYVPPPSRNDNFPLKKGSKGDRVKELQGLLLKYNPNALPNYGADGDFGSETENALFKQTGKKTVDNQSELDALRYSKSQFY